MHVILMHAQCISICLYKGVTVAFDFQKQLCHEQIALFKEKHREEVESLEMELKKAHHKLRESSRAYEEHIKSLTTDLWNVGEKFLVKKDEADWLRKKQKSGSLMSLQHVHSVRIHF